MKRSEKIALIGLICEYITESSKSGSQMSQVFVDVVTGAEINVFMLLQIVDELKVEALENDQG